MLRFIDDIRHIHLTELQATLLSFVIGGIPIVVLLIVLIGYGNTDVPAWFFGGLLAFILGIFIVLRPEIGTYVLVITVFTNLSDVFNAQGLPSVNKPLVGLITVSLAASIVLKQQFREKGFFHFGVTEISFLLYGTTWILAVFYAENSDRAYLAASDFVKDFIILLCVIYSLRTIESWRQALWLVMIAVSILAAMGAYQTVTGDYQQQFFGFAFVDVADVELAGRITGPIGDPNFFGQILAAALPIAIYRILDERKLFARLASVAMALILAFAIFSTYSRGAFLGMMAVLLLIALERKVSFSLLAIMGIAGSLLIAVLPTGYTERIQTIVALNPADETAVQSEGSFKGRLSEMQAGLLMFVEHPVLGVGAGNYMNHYQRYASRIGLEDRITERKAHSIYVEILAESGLAGIISFGAMFFSLFAGLSAARRKLRRIDGNTYNSNWLMSLQMSLTSYLLTSLFLHGDFIRYLWMLVALGVAILRITDKMPDAGAAATTPLKETVTV